MILLRHQYHLGLPDGSFPFSTAWIFVEFFFAISGYFTIVHFRKNQKKDDIDLAAKEAIIYAEKKWIRFLPYTFISVYMKCTMNYLNEGHGLIRFIIAFLEGALLIRGESNNGVLWYLSAMLIVLPLFCFFVQILPKYVSLIFAILGCIIYYDNNVLDCFFPMHLVRAIVGLSLGIIIYEFSIIIKKHSYTGLGKMILSVIEWGSFSFTVIATYYNKSWNKIYVVAFIVALSIAFSAESYSEYIPHSRSLRWLTELSMVIYIFQFVVADGLYMFTQNFDNVQMKIFYIIGTVLISIFIKLIVDLLKSKNMLKKMKELVIK